MIRCFTRWAHCQNPDIEVPPARLLPARPTRVAPYIYSAGEIQALLDAADTLKPVLRAATYRTVPQECEELMLSGPCPGTQGSLYTADCELHWK